MFYILDYDPRFEIKFKICVIHVPYSREAESAYDKFMR